MNDFVDPYIDSTEQIPFCQSDSMVCSPVSAIANTPEAFCKMMGFSMQQNNEGENVEEDDLDQIDKPLNQKRCFSGAPRQILEYGKIERAPRPKYYEPDQRSIFDLSNLSLEELMRQLADRYNKGRKIVRKNLRKLPFGIGRYIDQLMQYAPRLVFIWVCYQIVLILWSIWEEMPANREARYQRQAEISKRKIEEIREKRK